jgi:hypothetical protein
MWLLVLPLWLSACGSGTVAPTADPTAAHSAPSTAAPTTLPSEAAPLVLDSGPLKVTITSPADEAVVNSPQVDIVGQAPAETVISVGNVITVVEASGQFSITVPLEEGPNELEIIASDPDGNQVTTNVVVTYEAGG